MKKRKSGRRRGSSNAPPPDPSPARQNSTPTHDMTSPATPQGTHRAPVQQASPPVTLQETTQYLFGSFDPIPSPIQASASPTHSSPATPQETRSVPSEKMISARGNSPSSRSPAKPQPPGTFPARQDSPAPTGHVAPSKDGSSAPGNSSTSSRSPVQVQPPGITVASLRSRSSSGTPPQPKGPPPAQQYTSSRSPFQVQPPAVPPGITSASLRSRSSSGTPPPPPAQRYSPNPTCQDPSSAPGNYSSSSRCPFQQQPPAVPPGITSASLRSRSSSGTPPPPPGPPPAHRYSSTPNSAPGNYSSASSRCPFQQQPPAVPPGITSASLRSRSSSGTPPPPPGPPPAHRYSSTPNSAPGNYSSASSRSPFQLQPPAVPPGITSASLRSRSSTVTPPPPKGPPPAQRNSSTPTCHVAKPGMSPPQSTMNQGGVSSKVTPTKSSTSTEEKNTSGDKVPGSTPPPSTPPSQHRSSLTMNDDKRTGQMYLQYLQKHEKPNALAVLLSEQPLKITIDFRKLLKSNRSLAHTICNKKDRIWNILLEVSRTFLFQQMKDFNSKARIEGVSDETIQNMLINLELVFKNLPSQICTLLNFLESTTLTEFEELLEGHRILVPTDEGRRILHSVVAYLIQHHKEGKAWGGNWRMEDWDVENSRTVSLSIDPVEFTSDSLPAKDLARLDRSVVPKYLKKRDHLNVPPNQKLHLLFVESFRSDLRNRSGLTTEDYHELICSHPFIMSSESRQDLLFALYRFFRTWNWEFNVDYDSVFADKGLHDWTSKIRYGNSEVLKKIFWFGWDRRNPGQPYSWCLGHLLLYERHSLVHIRNHAQLIRKLIGLELLVSSRSSRFLPRLIRLMFQYGKVVGEVRRRWNIYVGSGLNERV